MKPSNKHYQAVFGALQAFLLLINKSISTSPEHLPQFITPLNTFPALWQTWVSLNNHTLPNFSFCIKVIKINSINVWFLIATNLRKISVFAHTVRNLRESRDVRHAIKTKVASLMSSRSSIWLIWETSRDGFLLS